MERNLGKTVMDSLRILLFIFQFLRCSYRSSELLNFRENSNSSAAFEFDFK